MQRDSLCCIQMVCALLGDCANCLLAGAAGSQNCYDVWAREAARLLMLFVFDLIAAKLNADEQMVARQLAFLSTWAKKKCGRSVGRREFKSWRRERLVTAESVISQAQGMFIFIAGGCLREKASRNDESFNRRASKRKCSKHFRIL